MARQTSLRSHCFSVFTKADLLFIPGSRDDYKGLVAAYTFPQRWRLTADELTGEFEKVRERFSDLLITLNGSPKVFSSFLPAHLLRFRMSD